MGRGYIGYFIGPDQLQLYRRVTFGGTGINATLVFIGLVRFSQTSGPVAAYIPFAFSAVVVMAAFTASSASQTRRKRNRNLKLPDPSKSPDLRSPTAVIVGAGLGVLWAIYVLSTHLLLTVQQKTTIGSALRWTTITFTALVILGVSSWLEYHGTYSHASDRFGSRVGVVAGLIATAATLLMLIIAMPHLAQHMTPSESAAFIQSKWHDRESWYYWNEEFLESTIYFLMLSFGGGLLGLPGGMIGFLMKRHRPKDGWLSALANFRR